MSGVSKLLWAEQLPQSEARRSRGWDGTGAPIDHEDFEIETAGTVLLRSEICMCSTPSLVLRTHVCTALDPGVNWTRFHCWNRFLHKVARSVQMPFTI